MSSPHRPHILNIHTIHTRIKIQYNKLIVLYSCSNIYVQIKWNNHKLVSDKGPDPIIMEKCPSKNENNYSIKLKSYPVPFRKYMQHLGEATASTLL